jgi:Tfp pilus assembly protein PilF
MTRAGEYLLRIGMTKAATVAARDAGARAESLLSAQVLGVRCALKEENKDWAIACTARAIDASLNPPAFFYEKLVRLKSASDPMATDRDMVQALRKLRDADPENAFWMQMLGYVCYKRGGVDMIHALYEMSAAIDHGVTNRTPYVIAAEAARFLGNTERAKDILRRGLSKYPDDLPMLNNLVYLLAVEKRSVDQALQMLPSLLARAPKEDLDIRDTTAVTYLRSGMLEKAEETLRRTLADVTVGSPPWFRATLHMAEIAEKRGQPAKARQLLNDGVKQARGIPDEDVIAANLILSAVSTTTNETGRQPSRNRPSWDLPSR